MKVVVTRRLGIHGHVQGVGFRWSLCAKARDLGVRGWVRNRADGSVDALVHGPVNAVDMLTAWARRGPSSARVERLDVFDVAAEFEELCDPFAQRPTV